MNLVTPILALATGVLAGAVFAFLRVPIPAPPTISGILGIVGIYLGFKAINALGYGFDLIEALGL